MNILTFGEIMLRFTPFNDSLVNPDGFKANFGGSESNVAVSLSCYGQNAYFLTKLPDNEISNSAIAYLNSFNVDTSKIVRGGERIGTYYYLPRTKTSKPRSVYDRKYSALSLAKREDFNWSKILENISWFHFSGITAALSDTLPLIILDALKECKKKNITVSLDVNYRDSLWSKEKARKTMKEFLPYIDICIANEEEAAVVFKEKDNQSLPNNAKIAFSRYPIKLFTSCWRDFKESGNTFSAVIFNKDKEYKAVDFPVDLKEDIGGGDSYAAGLITGILLGKKDQDLVDFACATGAMKYSIMGDSNTSSLNDVYAYLKKLNK